MKLFQPMKIENKEGIVLSVKKIARGGRLIHFFTKEDGHIVVMASESTIKKYGSGYLVPYAILRISVRLSDELFVLTQYEGHLLFAMLDCSYEEITDWYFVSELVQTVFPAGQVDQRVWNKLIQGALFASQHNKRICAFITVIQLLMVAGFNPLDEEPLRKFSVSDETEKLLIMLGTFTWGNQLGALYKKPYESAVSYINNFIPYYCDFKMKIVFEA